MLVSTFTPGPANISSASLAVIHGYRKLLSYLFGLAVGVFIMMTLSGLVSTYLLHTFPILEPALRYIGAAYILYLAFSILRASYHLTDTTPRPLGFIHGLTLQLFNPKIYVYAFTVFTGFLAPITTNFALVLLAAVILAAISFVSTTVWALFGTAIKTYLHNPRHILIVNIILALTLVYSALSLVGIL